MAAVFTKVTRNRFSPDGAMVAFYFKRVCVFRLEWEPGTIGLFSSLFEESTDACRKHQLFVWLPETGQLYKNKAYFCTIYSALSFTCNLKIILLFFAFYLIDVNMRIIDYTKK